MTTVPHFLNPKRGECVERKLRAKMEGAEGTGHPFSLVQLGVN